MRESSLGKLALCNRFCGEDKFRDCLRKFLADEMRKFGKDKFRKCLRIILADEVRKFGKDKFRKCPRIILVEDFDHDGGEEGKSFASGK